jgi:hypothetical protein
LAIHGKTIRSSRNGSIISKSTKRKHRNAYPDAGNKAADDKASDITRANPKERIGGLVATVTTPEHLRKPITPHERLMLIAYSEKGTPIIAKWFDHFELG